MNATVVQDSSSEREDRSEPLADLLGLLKAQDYAFTTPTPATHRRVIGRPTMQTASDLRDVFGWSLPFAQDLLADEMLAALEGGGGLRRDENGLRSAYRVSSLGQDLLLHTAYPPSAEDAVFFGPDTYRFARFLRQAIGPGPIDRLVDIGSGSGAGAIAVARSATVGQIVLTDINAAALAVAAINLAAAGLHGQCVLGDGLEQITEPADLIIANPPFIAGDGGRTYRDGGDMIGARLSLDWAMAAARMLTPGGRFILYTGSAIVDGADALQTALGEGLDREAYVLSYEEIDPDIFGGQLGARGYERVERIAAIGAIITRKA